MPLHSRRDNVVRCTRTADSLIQAAVQSARKLQEETCLETLAACLATISVWAKWGKSNSIEINKRSYGSWIKQRVACIYRFKHRDLEGCLIQWLIAVQNVESDSWGPSLNKTHVLSLSKDQVTLHRRGHDSIRTRRWLGEGLWSDVF